MPMPTTQSGQALIEVTVLSDIRSVAQKAAAIIAKDARDAVDTRGRFTFAVSGGHTPWVMLRALTAEEVPWQYARTPIAAAQSAHRGD